eukprot:1141803-Pelagomonas_calceolata.AAC.3
MSPARHSFASGVFQASRKGICFTQAAGVQLPLSTTSHNHFTNSTEPAYTSSHKSMLNKSSRAPGGQKLCSSSAENKLGRAVPRIPFSRPGAAVLGSRSLPAVEGGKQFSRRPSSLTR